MFTAPKISDLTVTSCVVDWTPLKPLGSDSLVYVLQLQRISNRDQDYHEASCVILAAKPLCFPVVCLAVLFSVYYHIFSNVICLYLVVEL